MSENASITPVSPELAYEPNPFVGGYSLHLYCRFAGESDCPFNYGLHGEVGGFQTARDSYREARRQGWRLDLKTNYATCPACVKRKRTR